MSDLAPVLRRFAEHEFEVRRRYASDSGFRAICEDYAAAASALAHWENDHSKAEDYRQLIRDLEDEILEYLQRPIGATKRTGPKNV